MAKDQAGVKAKKSRSSPAGWDDERGLGERGCRRDKCFGEPK